MPPEIPADASRLAAARSFGCGASSSIPCEELATTTSTVLHTKRSVPQITLERMGRLEGPRHTLGSRPDTVHWKWPNSPGRRQHGRPARRA